MFYIFNIVYIFYTVYIYYILYISYILYIYLISKRFGPDLTCAPVECGPPEELLHGSMILDICMIVNILIFLT